MEFGKVGNLVLTLLIVFSLAGCGSNNSTRPSSSGWDAAKMIESANAGDAVVPQVAMDDSGNATAVWNQFDGPYYSIWSSTYR